MNGFLRQSTASQSRTIGPFVSDSDFSPATGLTIGNTDIKLRANGATLSAKNSGGATHQVNGEYSVTWDATDTANVGELKYSVFVSGALVHSGTYQVITQAAYDAQFGSAAPGYVANAPVDVQTIKGNPVVNGGTLTFPSNATLASTTNVTGGTITTVTNLTNDPPGVTTLLARIGAFTGSGVNTVLGMFKALLSKTASTPSDVGGTFSAATDSTEAIRDRGDAAWTTATGFSTLDAAGVRNAVGLATNNLDTQLSGIGSKTALIPATPAAVGSAMTLTTPTKESISDTWTARNIQGGSNDGRTNGEALAALRNKVIVDDLGNGTVYDNVDGDPLWTFTATRTPGDPISAVDPE